MKKQSPFYKTGIAKSPLNYHVPGHDKPYGMKQKVKDNAKKDKESDKN